VENKIYNDIHSHKDHTGSSKWQFRIPDIWSYETRSMQLTSIAANSLLTMLAVNTSTAAVGGHLLTINYY